MKGSKGYKVVPLTSPYVLPHPRLVSQISYLYTT
jgi:hypothetical protein